MNDSIRSRQRVLESIHVRMAASLALTSAIAGHRNADRAQTRYVGSAMPDIDSHSAHLGLEKIRRAVATARPDELTSREVVAAIKSWARAQSEWNHDAETADLWNATFRDMGANPAVALREAARMRARYSKAIVSGCVGEAPRSVAWQIVA